MSIKRCKNCINWDNKTHYGIEEDIPSTWPSGRCEVLEQNILVDISTTPVGQYAQVDYIFTKSDFVCGGFAPKLSDDISIEDLERWDSMLEGISHNMSLEIPHSEKGSASLFWGFIGDIGNVRQDILDKINN